jgi:hypothetical protein
MAFNFSPKFKDIQDFTRAYGSFLSILTIVVSLFFAFDIKDIEFDKMSAFEKIVIKSIAALIIIIPLIIYNWDNIRIRYVMFKGNLKGFIIEKQDVLIDIQDDGKHATYFLKIYFHKLSRKNKDQYVTKLNVSGTINSNNIQSINCDYSFTDIQRKNLRLTYTNNISKLNDVKNFFKENDRFLFFYTDLENTFTSLEESWDMEIINLCHDYNIQILMPAGKKLNYAKFVRVKNPTEVEEVEYIQPIIIQETDRQRLVLQVMNFDKNEHYKIIWS